MNKQTEMTLALISMVRELDRNLILLDKVVTNQEIKNNKLEAQVKVARETLESISDSHDWGRDTALRRSISDLRTIASTALAEIDKESGDA